MSEKLYDILKLVGRIVLPLGTFVAAVCQIWGLPYGDRITATMAALAALINAILGISSAAYWQEHEIRQLPESEDVTDGDT